MCRFVLLFVVLQSGVSALLVTSPSLQFMFALDEAFEALRRQNAPMHKVSQSPRRQCTDQRRLHTTHVPHTTHSD